MKYDSSLKHVFEDGDFYVRSLAGGFLFRVFVTVCGFMRGWFD